MKKAPAYRQAGICGVSKNYVSGQLFVVRCFSKHNRPKTTDEKQRGGPRKRDFARLNLHLFIFLISLKLIFVRN